MTRVLLTDGEQRSTLAVVRSLGRAGHEVFVVSSADRPLAGASRYCHAARTVPDPAADPAAFRDRVEAVVRGDGIDVLIPMTDVSASLLLQIRDANPALQIPFPDREAYEAISDKRRLVEVAARLGVPVPQGVVIEESGSDREEARRWAAERGFDVVLKPSRSVAVGPEGAAKAGVAVVGSAERFEAALAAYPPSAFPLLVQERIHGPGLGAFLLARKGEPVAHFAHRRLREKPPTGGVSVYRESIELRSDLRAYAEQILKAFEWTGVAMVEFKEDEATGRPYLMEVNGRFWGSLQLAIDAGVDFPILLLRLMRGDDPEPVTRYRTGVRSRWLWGDVDHLLWILRASRATRRAHPDLPTRFGALIRFGRPWWPGDRLEVLWLRDARPFARESLNWFRSLVP